MISVDSGEIAEGHIGLTADILFDLEESLGKPTFFGVPLGSTLGGNFSVLFKGNQELGFRIALRDILLCVKYLFRKIPNSPIDRELPKRRILVTWLGDRPSLREMVLPLIRELGSSRCLVIGAVSEMKSSLPDETAFMTWDQAPTFDIKIWRKEILPLSLLWLKTIMAACRKHQLSLQLVPSLVKSLLIQSQKVMAFQCLLDEIEPIGVITEYDRNHNASCLVLLSRIRNIPSISLQHGLVNPPYGYTPILADHLLCWGEPQRQLLIELGANPMSVHVTGAMSNRSTTLASKDKVCDKLGLRSDSPLILLATSPVNKGDRKKLVKAFCTRKMPTEIQRVVRLHPSEQLDFYASEIAQYTDVRFTHNNEFTLDEILAAADFICCHDSTVGLQALIKRKPVLILDVLSAPLSGSREYVEAAGCPRLKTAEEFVDAMKQILSNTTEYDILFQEQLRYVNENYAYSADEAVKATANMINAIVNRDPINGSDQARNSEKPLSASRIL